MAKIIKVRCNGPKQCVNEVDIEALIRGTIVFKTAGTGPKPRLLDRYVKPCRSCSEGDVVVTRAMIEPHLSRG